MQKRRATGVILAAVLIGLLVVMLLSVELVRAVVLDHRRASGLEKRSQALWLAESAVARARGRLAESADYAGETWRVPADVLGGRAGVAVIRVEPVGEPQPGWRIRVEARYPEGTAFRILHQRELRIVR